MKYVLSLVVCVLAYAIPASAHNFKLDSYGCHNNGALNVYECHNGVMRGKSWSNPGGKTQMLVELNTPPPPPPPPPPPTPQITVSGHKLDWIQVVPPEVTGFRLWWKVDETWHGPIEMGRLTSYVLPDLLAKASYVFVVAAYNKDGESPKSNEATLTIP